MMKKYFVSISFLMLLIGSLSAQSLYPGQHKETVKKGCEAPMRVKSFDLKDVRLLPSRFAENMSRDSMWLASISVDRLLHSFRTSAGVFASREGGYMTVKKLGGWESLDCDLRGHTTGHVLSAYALMSAATDSDYFKQKGDSLVLGLKVVQQSYGTGYLSAYPEGLINRNMRGEGVWAPWYTLHKIVAGLIDQYLYAGNQTALELACSMGDWAHNKLKDVDEATRQKMIRNEFGGINEAFYNLYSITEDSHHLWLARFFYHNEVIDPLAQGRDELGTRHTNTFIPKVIAEARNYEIHNDTTSRKIGEFFFDTMLEGHTYAAGCCSDKEHFFDPQKMSQHLSGYTGESCCTYNMLKLARHLFCWEAEERVAEFYERALYNHILGQQDPQTGMISYFLPMLSGAHKVYSTPENSFWCCVGSGFENHAKYGEAIYYHNDSGIYVNLFIPSKVEWHDKGVTLTQQTQFPQSEVVTLSVDVANAVATTIYLRYPSWSSQPTLKINGRKVAVKQEAGTYIELSRVWKQGDTVEVTYPMSLRVSSPSDNPNKVVLSYGPLVLAGELGTEGMQAPAPHSDPSLYNDYYTYNYNIPTGLNTSIKLDRENPEKSVVQIGNELRFKNSDGVIISPLYDIHRQRYVVYWDF